MFSCRVLISVLLVAQLAVAPYAAHAYTKARVINGQASTDGAFPWIVSFSENGADPAAGHFCAGVLIRPEWVLTAAHCVIDVANNPSAIQIVTGRTDLSSSQGEIVSVAGILVHPKADPSVFRNDVALVKLSKPIALPTVGLLTPEEELSLGSSVVAEVAGWGATDPLAVGSEAALHPTVLQRAALPIVPTEQCKAAMGASLVPEEMICAGTLSQQPTSFDGVDSCNGDSGGPLMVQTPSGLKVAGLVSWGLECASSKYYGIYSRVSHFAAWVTSVQVLPPFASKRPTVTGSVTTGGRLTCIPPQFAENNVDRVSYLWRDVESKEVLGKSPSLRLARSDIGRRIDCTVVAENAGGVVELRSRSTQPIVPRSSVRKLKVRGAKLQFVGLYCAGSRCQLTVEFKSAVRNLKAMIVDKKACVGGSPCSATSWFAAKQSSPQSWILRFPKSELNFKRIFLRAISELGEGSKLIELS